MTRYNDLRVMIHNLNSEIKKLEENPIYVHRKSELNKLRSERNQFCTELAKLRGQGEFS